MSHTPTTIYTEGRTLVATLSTAVWEKDGAAQGFEVVGIEVIARLQLPSFRTEIGSARLASTRIFRLGLI
jgi:hypothetical protein